MFAGRALPHGRSIKKVIANAAEIDILTEVIRRL